MSALNGLTFFNEDEQAFGWTERKNRGMYNQKVCYFNNVVSYYNFPDTSNYVSSQIFFTIGMSPRKYFNLIRKQIEKIY